MQGLLVAWLDRYNALLEPTDMETAMRDEVNLALASLLAAEVSPVPAGIMRVLGGAQSARLTAARMCLIQTVYTHGEKTSCTECLYSYDITCSKLFLGPATWVIQTHRGESIILYCNIGIPHAIRAPCKEDSKQSQTLSAVPCV